MQTSGLPPSPTPTARSSGKSSFAKSASAGEDFGKVMHRALSSDEFHAPAAQPPANKSPANQPPANQSSVNQPLVNQPLVNQPLVNQPLANQLPVAADTGETDTKSKTSASDSTAKPVRPSKTLEAQPTTLVALLTGITVPAIPAPVVPPVQPTGTAHEVPMAKEIIPPASVAVPTIEPVDLKSSAAATPTKAEPAQKPADIIASTTADTTADLKTPDAKSPGVPPVTIPTLGAVAAEELAATTADAPVEIADPVVEQGPDAVSGQKSSGKSASDPLSVSPKELRGTSAAKQDPTMNKTEKTPKIAGATEQELPGNASPGSNDSSNGPKISTKLSIHTSEKLETVTVSSLRALDSIDSPVPVATNVAVTPASMIDTRVLERTHDIVALHAMRLNDTNSDTLHVVIKPGAGIQLALELRQSARGIEVSASLHKGDYDQLKQHWPELQQRLEARGVRVGNLTTSESFTGAGHQQFNQSKQSSTQQDPLHTGAFAEFALAGAVTEAPAARAARTAAYRGWETWA